MLVETISTIKVRQISSLALMEQHEEMAWMLRSFIEGEALVANGARPDLEAKTPVGV